MEPFGCKFACLLFGMDIVLGATVRLSGSAYAVLGQTFRFTCTVTDDTTPTLGTVGFNRGTQQVSYSSPSCGNPTNSEPGYSRLTCGSSGVYYMNISSVGLQDATTWKCERRSDSDTFILPVYYGPYNNITLDKSSPQTVTESSSLTVTCSATCNPCSYTWKKGTTTVSTSRTLSLTNINRNQAGDYICTATNTQTGSAPRSTTLTVIVQYLPEVSLDTPSGSSSCRPYRVYVGQQNVQLTCRVTAANPAVMSYIWTHNGSPIPSATSSVYSLSPVSRSSGGSYTCAGRNSVGTSSSPPSLQVDAQYAPSLNLPSSRTVTEGQTLTVTCSVDSNPTASVTWTRKDGDSFTPQSGSTLTITNIQRSQTGTYVCTATNTLSPCSGAAPPSTPVSKEVTVDVQYLPEVSLDTPSGTSSCRPYRVYVGQQNVQLTCRVTTANPTVTSYTWTRNGSPIPSATSSVYSLSPVSKSSEGSYTCAGRNSVGTSSSPPSLQVDAQYAPSLNLPSSKTVTEGQTLTVACSVDSNPTASVTWTRKDGGSFTPQSGSTLTISNIQRSQTGTYVCTATNTLSPCNGAAPPSTPVTKEVTVDVQYGPGSSVTVSPTGDLERVEGSGPFTATCTADCNPSCSISWRKGSTNLPQSQLNISNISRSDQGNYTCQAQNGIGGPGQKMFTITVYYMDRPGLSLDKSEVKENDTVDLNCSVVSNPTVEMTIENIDNDTVVVQRNTNTLSYTIQRVECLHNGTYVCSADNRKTENVYTNKRDLNVLCAPRHDSRKQLNDVQAISKNESAKFVADVIANPVPSFSWYKTDEGNDSAISNDSDHSISSTSNQSVLEINVTREDDYGDYAVVVNNTQGSYRLKFKLTAKNPPSAPEGFKILTTPGDTSVSLSWTSGFNGGDEQTFTLEYRADTESQWKTWKEGIPDPGQKEIVKENVTELTPSTTYTFQVYGVNKFGLGEKVSISATTVKTEPIPPSSNVALAAGAGVGAAVVIVVVVVIVVIFMKRKRNKEKGYKDEEYNSEGKNKEKNEDELVLSDNVLYESASGVKAKTGSDELVMQENDLYSTSANVQGAAAAPFAQPNPGDVYAQVKPKKKGVEGDTYAQPMKKGGKDKGKDKADKDDTYAKPMKGKTPEKGKEKARGKGKDGIKKEKKNKKEDKMPLKKTKPKRGDVYENTTPGQFGDGTYANTAFVHDDGSVAQSETQEPQGAKSGKDDDGCTYVTVDFGNAKPGTQVLGTEDSTEYAGIAFGKVGPPLPPDEEEKKDA